MGDCDGARAESCKECFVLAPCIKVFTLSGLSASVKMLLRRVRRRAVFVRVQGPF